MKRYCAILLISIPAVVGAHDAPQCEIDLQPPDPGNSGVRIYEADSPAQGYAGFLAQYGTPAVDCDPINSDRSRWQCSDEQIGSNSAGISNPTPEPPATSNPESLRAEAERYQDGDLCSLHYDYSYDPDDMQAIIAGREIVDDTGIDCMVVSGAKSHANSGVLSGSLQHSRSLFPDALDAQDSATVARTATAWQLTLATSDDVWIAEGGPSDFTASVLRELQSRGVTGLKRIHVVQHSTWNEDKTLQSSLQYVKSLATYTKIEDGNQTNATPDLNSGTGDSAFRSLALNSRYAAQWANAFGKIGNKVDFSDTVELLHILGIPKSAAPTPMAFAAKYF